MASLILALLAAATVAAPGQGPAAQPLPTGQSLTPLAAPGAQFEPLRAGIGPFPDYRADGAAAIAVSPNGREMLVLTSGFNRFNGPDGKLVIPQSGEYVFRYAIDAKGARLVQTVSIRNSYSGVAWTPDGRGFLVGGGMDDTVHRFEARGTEFVETGTPIKLGHKAGNGADVLPEAAGVAVSPDGARALVANYYNDSVSLVDLKAGKVIAERDLRPGKIDPAKAGVPGGEFPFAVVWTDPTHAYVSAPRDREIVALSVGQDSLQVAGRIKTLGEPTALLVDRTANRLYATEDNADRLAVVDLRAGKLVGEPRLGLPSGMTTPLPGKGINPNGMTLLRDHRLLVTLGGINALAVVAPGGAAVQGLVPTGWYPSAVATDAKGARVFVINRKSPPGPNPEGCMPRLAVQKSQPNACGAANQYIFQLENPGSYSFRCRARAPWSKPPSRSPTTSA